MFRRASDFSLLFSPLITHVRRSALSDPISVATNDYYFEKSWSKVDFLLVRSRLDA